MTILRIKILANNVHDIEQTTRMLQEMSLQRATDARDLEDNDYKWHSVGRGLTTFSEGFAYVAFNWENDLRILSFLDEIDHWLEEAQQHCHANNTPSTQVSHERTALLRSWIQGTLSRITYLEKWTQAQVQTLYNLIAQRDNAVAIQLAEASRATAEASLCDKRALKELALDSKNIAAATQKDSAAMRTIAIVTVVCLPGTFTATLFSADFFNSTC